MAAWVEPIRSTMTENCAVPVHYLCKTCERAGYEVILRGAKANYAVMMREVERQASLRSRELAMQKSSQSSNNSGSK